jgi:hypothetical protein
MQKKHVWMYCFCFFIFQCKASDNKKHNRVEEPLKAPPASLGLTTEELQTLASDFAASPTCKGQTNPQDQENICSQAGKIAKADQGTLQMILETLKTPAAISLANTFERAAGTESALALTGDSRQNTPPPLRLIQL